VRRPLPVLGAPTTDAARCSDCGGKCCKSYPGIAVPEDFGAPDRDLMQTKLRAALSSGRWAIDWWEGDPRPDCDALYQAEFVRPANKGHEGDLFHPSWGGPCTFLRKDGCELAHDDRPRNCRGVVPRHPESCTEKHEDGTLVSKEDFVIAWIPYIGLLLSVADEVRRP
jgi:Fe-S-cluster containining protein